MLLDTDVVVDVLRGYPPALAWLESLQEDERILLPGLVVMEVIHGCQNKQEQQRVESFLSSFEVVWPQQATCARALDTFASTHLSHSLGILELEKSGQASDDLLSATHRRSCPQHDSQRLIDRFVRRERFRDVWIEAG